MRSNLRWWPGILALVVFHAAAAQAGQVRVTVGAGGNVFSPSDVSLNAGDHVVFVWASGTHSATSGNPSVCEFDNLYFDSGTVPTNSARGTAFTWKSPATSIPMLQYFCLPHCPSMAGILRVTSGNAVANFRVTEVKTNAAGNLDLIEITNFGTASGNLGRYRIVASSDSAIVPANDWIVPAGGRVVVHANQNLAQVVPSDLYLPSFSGLDETGYVALYAPNTVNGSFVDPTQMIDFVQIGAGGSAREITAVSAGLWTAGTFATAVASGHSLEFCGGPTDRGATFWTEVSSPNFGTDGNCATPANSVTWGRVKTIYR